MLRILPKMIGVFTIGTLLFTSQINGYCSRCVKIEGERAEEQAKNPQPLGYYDDQLKLSLSEQPATESDRSTKKEAESLNESTKDTPESSSKPSESIDKPISSEKPEVKTKDRVLLASTYSVPTSKEEFFEEDEAIPLTKPFLPSSKNSNNLKENNLSDEKKSLLTSSNPSYSTLLTILKTKLLLETLDGSFTLFIPTNEALKQLSSSTLIDLTKPENQEKLAALVSNHVVAKKILRKDFEANQNREIKAISGRNLTVRSDKGKLTIDDAQILNMEPAGYDGVIYIIDKVLFP